MNKTTLMAAALATMTFATTTNAGSLADPVIEPPLIVEDATSSSSGTSLVAILTVLTILASID